MPEPVVMLLYLGLVMLLVMAGVVLTLSIVLYRQLSRYEQFRGETALVFAEAFEQLADVNGRLVQAGYPPGRVASPVPGNTPP